MLLGRGSGANRWKGNIKFRDLVLHNFQYFLAKRKCNTTFSSLDPHLKNQLAYNVYSTVSEEYKGRFLQKLYRDEMSTKKQFVGLDIVHTIQENNREVVFVEVSEKQAMEKIKQSFRFLNDQKEERKIMKEAKKKAVMEDLETPSPKSSSTKAASLKPRDVPPVVLKSSNGSSKNGPSATPPMSAANLLFQHQLHQLQQQQQNAFPPSLRSALLLNGGHLGGSTSYNGSFNTLEPTPSSSTTTRTATGSAAAAAAIRARAIQQLEQERRMSASSAAAASSSSRLLQHNNNSNS